MENKIQFNAAIYPKVMSIIIGKPWLYGVVEYELISLLKEYWFDEPMKVKDWSENLRSTIK